MIVKNRLLNSDFCIYQDGEWFKFSIDSVLLANFLTLNLRAKKIIDLACGNAPIPMFLSFRTNAMIYGIEYQKCVYDLAVRSVEENKLGDRICLINDDVRNLRNIFASDSFDVVTCNPPYFKVNSDSLLNDNIVKANARHELNLNLDDVLKQAKYLLKNGGIFAMIHRTERFVEILDKFKEYGIEPKRLQFIYPKSDRNSDLFLIEGMKNGKSGLKILKPLIVHEDNNDYTMLVNEMLDFNCGGCNNVAK